MRRTSARSPETAPSTGQDNEPARAPRRWLVPALVIAAVVLAGAGLGSYLGVLYHDQHQPRPAGIPASVPTGLANLMQLSSVPAIAAPGFSLTDQHGRTVSLASLRGRAVVLDFMDPHCTDICPIVSAELIDAYRELGPAARQAVFVAVNVNPYYRSVADVATFTSEHQLDSVRSWHFLTGNLASLRAVWQAYNIDVVPTSRTSDVQHTSEIVFISPSGIERYVAAPMDDLTAAGTAYLPAGQLAAWGHGIALVTRQLER